MPRTWPAQTGWIRPGWTGVPRTSARPTGVRRRRRLRLRWQVSRFLVRRSRLPGLRTPRRPCRLLPPTSTPQAGRFLTGALPSRAGQTGWSQRRAPLSRPDQTRVYLMRVRPMRVRLVGAPRTRVLPMRVRLVGVPRTRVRPMGAHRVRLPRRRRRRLRPGGPCRLLCRRCLRCRRWCRPAHSGLPRPRPPSNQPNQFSRAGRPSQVSHPNRANRGLICPVECMSSATSFSAGA